MEDLNTTRVRQHKMVLTDRGICNITGVCDVPVSYTHLDVYKRQNGCLRIAPGMGLRLFFKLRARRKTVYNSSSSVTSMQSPAADAGRKGRDQDENTASRGCHIYHTLLTGGGT